MNRTGFYIAFLVWLCWLPCRAQNNGSSANDAWSLTWQSYEQLSKKDTSGVWNKLNEASAEFNRTGNTQGKFYILINRGSYYFLQNNTNATFEFYYEALELSKTLKNDTITAEAYFNIGQKQYLIGNYPIAAKNLGSALRIYEHYKKEDKAAMIYRMYAAMQLTLGTVKDAISYLEKALGHYKKINDKHTTGAVLNTMGHAYMQLNDTVRSKEYFYESLSIRAKIKDTVGIGQVYTNLGTLAYRAKQYDSALEFYRSGLELREKGRAPRSAVIESHIFIGKSLYAAGNTKQAAAELEKALEMGKNIEVPELERRALEVLKDVYRTLGDREKAYIAQEKYYMLKDSLYGVEKREAMLKESVGQDFEKRIYEDSLKNAEKVKQAMAVQEEKDKRHSMIRNVLVCIVLLACGIVFLLYQRNKEKKKANTIITAQRDELRMRQEEIADSINYARQIQTAMLPNPALLGAAFPQSFALYLPKDIVSGDFYWFAGHRQKMWIAAADCTGHGVPGAFMSMISIDKLHQAVLEMDLEKPSQVLSHINRTIKLALRQDEQGSRSRDGMDIALCTYDPATMVLTYSGANRPLWWIRDNEIIEHKPTKASIGGWTHSEQEFAQSQVQLQPGDAFYIFTDGYADQFGGDNGKKLRTGNFRKLLLSIQHLPMHEQEKYLLDHHLKWKGKLEQVDDILVIGIKV